MVGERLLVGWDLVEEPVVLPVILAMELEPGWDCRHTTEVIKLFL